MSMNRNHSSRLFSVAQKVMPGGVNSPVRAFNAVGGDPLFIKSARGVRITDVDGNEFIDYVGSWGPLIFGHAHPQIVSAITRQAQLGTSYGASTELEIQLAEKVIQAIPSVEVVRMVNSGTEAVMSALRLARGITGRDKIVKFEGCYHGHSDSLLVKAGSGLISLGIPECPGIVSSLAEKTLNLPYNNTDQVRELFEKEGKQIAALIVEPIGGNMGVVPPKPGFLAALREVTQKAGALLIFDEVITGFRVSSGGAQKLYGVNPEITCLGKIIGGGLPVGAYGGSREVMDHISPVGSVYQAGTLSGNPLAMAAGQATLDLLDGQAYQRLEATAARLAKGLVDAFTGAGLDAVLPRVGSLLGLFLGDREPTCFDEVKVIAENGLYPKVFHALLERGVALAPGPYEVLFPSLAHTDEVVDSTVEAAVQAAAAVAASL